MADFRSDNLVILIGAMKCGTSSLHQYMALHPEIAMSRRKELNFFVAEKTWPRGLRWYESQLPAGRPWRGESSPNYTKYPSFAGVPQRMAELAPEARLIYVVRDPVQRLTSHYVHNLADGRETRPIEQAMADPEHNHYVWTSRYFAQLRQYLEVFAPEQLLVLDADELRTRRPETLAQVFRFLDVRADFHHPDFERIHHESSRKRQPIGLGRAISRTGGGKAVRRLLPWLLERPITRPRLPDAVRDRLRPLLAEDAAELRKLTGLPLRRWSV